MSGNFRRGDTGLHTSMAGGFRKQPGRNSRLSRGGWMPLAGVPVRACRLFHMFPMESCAVSADATMGEAPRGHEIRMGLCVAVRCL